MASMMQKIGDKLHMGGNKDEEKKHQEGGAAGYGTHAPASGYGATTGEPGYGGTHAPASGYGATTGEPGYGGSHATGYGPTGTGEHGYGATTGSHGTTGYGEHKEEEKKHGGIMGMFGGKDEHKTQETKPHKEGIVEKIKKKRHEKKAGDKEGSSSSSDSD